jgi:hypothetical protein
MTTTELTLKNILIKSVLLFSIACGSPRARGYEYVL